MSKAIYAQFNEADRFCGLIAAASVGDEVKLTETNVHGQQERVWYVPDATKPGYCLALASAGRSSTVVLAPSGPDGCIPGTQGISPSDQPGKGCVSNGGQASKDRPQTKGLL